MSIEMHQITVNGLVVDVVRKNIKNLHLSVYPPNGRVRVAAPLRVDDEAARLAVISRMAWIKRCQAKFEGQERQSAREYVSGESHYFQGRRYLLNVIYHDAPPKVIISNKTTLDLFVRTGSDAAKREHVLVAWHRKQLKEMIPPLIAKWEAITFFNRQGQGVKLVKLGTYLPKIALDGKFGVSHRLDVAIRNGLNAPDSFSGEIANRSNVGKTPDELVAQWNAEHPEDPVQV